MGFFRKDKEKEEESGFDAPIDCPHVALSARWDDLDDMGRDDKVSAWVCQSCSESFTPGEVEQLRKTEADRIGAASL